MAKKKTQKHRVHVVPQKYVEAVKRGVAFLDLVLGRKEWLSRMDMSNFDLSDPRSCVAGNVFQDTMFKGSENGFGAFCNAMETLGDDSNWAERFGFDSDGSTKGYQHLQDIWVHTIKTLKSRRR